MVYLLNREPCTAKSHTFFLSSGVASAHSLLSISSGMDSGERFTSRSTASAYFRPRASSPALEKVTRAIPYPASASDLTSTEMVSTVRRFMPTVSNFESGQSAIAVRSNSSLMRMPSDSPSSRSA